MNWCTRFCRPLRNHSATWPHETDLLQIIKGLSNLLRLVRRQFLKSNPMSLLKWLAPRLLTGRYDHQSSTALGVGTISQAHELIGRDNLPKKVRQLAGLSLRQVLAVILAVAAAIS